MKKLTDLYIKVTKQNQEELKQIIGFDPTYGNVCFEWDGLDGAITTNDPYLKQKVSLSELKRLIDTIPTREEITRLKRQISAYKTNYDKVVKHSLSKEVVIDNLQKVNEYIHDILEEQRDIIITQSNEIHKLKESYNELNEKACLKLDELHKVKEHEKVLLESMSNINKENMILITELERLKNKKWYKIWAK